MINILTIIGARPQFIKAAAVSRIFLESQKIKEVILHTGQHYDPNMSDIFFEQMMIPQPKYNLGLGSLSHGAMTGRMIEEIEKILIKEKPDWLMVYGDTNSTLSGALAAVKLHIPVAHVEAGLRSFNMTMPEEINRILTDRVSNLLFCPTITALNNLENEGYGINPFYEMMNTGDVMQDAVLFFNQFSRKPLGIGDPKDFILATIHRAENTDIPDKLAEIIEAFNIIAEKHEVIVPMHPRTRNFIKNNNLVPQFKVIDPVGYLEMLWLLDNSKLVMTDSGGLQKEAYFFKKNCITLRDETEWTELIHEGVNILTPIKSENILESFRHMWNTQFEFGKELFGGGQAANRIQQKFLSL